MTAQTEPRRYLTDDRDAPEEEQHELVVFQGENGDWYVGVWRRGARGSPNTVRICTSGGASSVIPLLPVYVSRVYRLLGPQQEPPRTALELPQRTCTHALILPMGTGYGRCMACGDDSFPMTGEAANQCPSCGSYGEHGTRCDGVVRMPWALARQALDDLQRTYSGPVPSTMASAVEALRRITGEIQDVTIPGDISLVVTYDGARATCASWKGITQQHVARASLAMLGLELEGDVVATGGERGHTEAVCTAAVCPVDI